MRRINVDNRQVLKFCGDRPAHFDEVDVRRCRYLADEHRGTGVLEDELEFVFPIGRVDVDDDDAEFGRRIHRQHPFGNVLGEDPEAVALIQAAFHKGGGQAIGVTLKFGIGPRAAGG